MATPVIMPRQGQSVESCIIGKWHKNKGDKVSVGDILFTYETDKATFDEESKVEGIMLDVFYEEGDDVECLLNVCVIGNDGESTAEFRPDGAASADETAAAPVAVVAEAPAVAAVGTVNRDGGFVKISPRARALAAKEGVDVVSTPATGPDGRIIERDVKAMIAAGNISTSAASADYQGRAGISGTGIGGRVSISDLGTGANNIAGQAGAPAADGADYVEVPHTNIRKVIAKSMHASLSNMAQLTLNSSYDMTEVNAFRAKVKASKDKLGLPNVTINDVILYTVSRALLNHPEVNAHYYDDKMLKFNSAHVAMAVDTPRGLLVPVLFNADKMSLSDISAAARQSADAAIEGKISPDRLAGGTFTVTNLGTLGIESFTPVINPPQTAILGVNTIETRVKEVNGELKAYKAMTLSLTFDHRALDGAPAARFLQEVVNRLENFTATLAL